MKKIIIGIVAGILLVGAILGIVFGVRSCKSKASEATKKVAVIQMFEDKQEVTIGKPVIFQFYAYSDTQYRSITYSLNNGTEQVLTDVTSGEAKEHKEYDGESAKYYVDTGVQFIDTTDMTAGYYTLVFYGHTAEGDKSQLNVEPYLFKLVVVATA